MSELEQKKKLLIAESEVYREMLKLEFQTFRIYGMRAKRKVSSFNTYIPMLLTGFPLVKTLFSRKHVSLWKQLGTLVYLGWQGYRRFGPILRGAFTQGRAPEKTAAEEYLAKRI